MHRNVEPDFACQILAAFETREPAGACQTQPLSPDTHTSVQPALVEPLSERELQVLRLLESSLTQREIADQLYVSVNTVRSHVQHIYGKLGVHSRIEALNHAQDLGLLQQRLR